MIRLLLPYRSGRRRLGPRGFGLVELLISVSILGISLTLFLSAANAARYLFAHQRNLTQAVAVGDTVTEGLLILDSSDEALAEGEHMAMFTRQGLPTSSRGFYQVTWVVSNYEEVTGMRKLDITIDWQEQGIVRSTSWTTYRN